MAQHDTTTLSSPTLILPGLSHYTTPQAPQQDSIELPSLTLEEYSSIASAPELANLKIPHLTSEHFENNQTSLAEYATTIWNNNRYTIVSIEAIIGKWILSIKENIKEPTSQQKWLDQINCPEFHRIWELKLQILRNPIPLEFSLYQPENLPFSGKAHNSIRMYSRTGPLVIVPYYGHISLKILNYFHLLKALPDLNPQLPATYIQEKEFVYNIFAGIIRNIFYFETEEYKIRAISQISTDAVKAHWLGVTFRKNLTGHPTAQAFFKSPALDRTSILNKEDWKLKDGVRHRIARPRKLRPGAQRKRLQKALEGVNLEGGNVLEGDVRVEEELRVRDEETTEEDLENKHIQTLITKWKDEETAEQKKKVMTRRIEQLRNDGW
ncbi:MAG: hypothetical protein M1812_006162 [Candelaria pacifica]|nr:MAG: hypothetical protein M1812_006162 [Candelaria pacifica]